MLNFLEFLYFQNYVEKIKAGGDNNYTRPYQLWQFILMSIMLRCPVGKRVGESVSTSEKEVKPISRKV